MVRTATALAAETAPTRRPPTRDTRERILAAARDVFAEHSFEGAATREIAERAGVTQPLLNYHFTSKDELWRAVVDSLFDELTEALETREHGLRGVDELTTAKLLVREFIYFSARTPQLHRIITGESRVDGPRMDFIADHSRPHFESTTARWERLLELGVVPPIAPANMYYILTGAGPTMFVVAPECRRVAGLDPSADEVISDHADAVITVLFGVCPQPADHIHSQTQETTH